MHPNLMFRQSTREQDLEQLRQRGFGLLILNNKSQPILAHLPFVISADGQKIFAHLSKQNRVIQAITATQSATLVVNCGDAYVSPNWYSKSNQVPTWNYVAIHVHGAIKILPDSELPRVLEQLSAEFEARLAPETPWTMHKMEAKVRQTMQKAITALEFTIESVESTWKLSQNKDAAQVQRVANGICKSDIGQGQANLLEHMRESVEEKKPDPVDRE